jgi:hypothetical protein
MKNGYAPAFPREGLKMYGLSKREYVAAMLIPALLTGKDIADDGTIDAAVINSIELADRLLEAIDARR